MSELRADTITASDGTSPVTLTKQSAAKAVFCMNMNGAAALESGVGGAINTSSLVDNGSGDGTVSFTNNMSGRKYPVMHDNTADAQQPAAFFERTTQVYHNFGVGGFTATRDGSLASSIRLNSYYNGDGGGAGLNDYSANFVVIHGDLAT
jgi:hypothetical protein